MAAAHPGSKGRKELGELGRVNAVLLQVGQAGVVALTGRAAGAPVAARHVLGLREEEAARARQGAFGGPTMAATSTGESFYGIEAEKPASL